MMTNPWKYIFASVIGASHTKTGTPCQDTSDCRVFAAEDGSEILVAVAADGAGSASRAQDGAALACSLFIGEMNSLFESGGSVRDITREFAGRWLTRFHNEIALRGEAEELKKRDFACTLLAAVVGADSAAFVQIGDGAIIIPSREEPDEYCWIFWPQQGEYANTTNFATDTEALDRLEHSLLDERVDEVAVLTDGLQNIALHFQTQTVHTPFFRPIFEWLRPVAGGYSEKLSFSLASYLNSPKVNDCTDDDKTLILATRRAAARSPANVEGAHESEGETTGL